MTRADRSRAKDFGRLLKEKLQEIEVPGWMRYHPADCMFHYAMVQASKAEFQSVTEIKKICAKLMRA